MKLHSPTTTSEPEFRPEISFRGHLLAKLNLILWSTPTKQEAARLMGVYPGTLTRWLGGTQYPEPAAQQRIDERYAIAVEKRRLHQVRLARKREQYHAAKAAAATKSIDAV